MLIIANWKCNPQTLKEAKLLFNMVKKGAGDIKGVKVIICPPFTYFTTLDPPASAKAAAGKRPSSLKLGSQNCFFSAGPFTGEISPQMLRDLGCEYVIVGHSERRALGESDELINKKIKAALEIGLKPVLCIGETEKERKQGKTKEVLKCQLKKCLIDLEPEVHGLKFLIAYEPIWAIGSKNPCDFEDAKEVRIFIEEILAKILGKTKAESIPILYGGSVDSAIASDYIKESGMKGLLVGGASLDAKEFNSIIKKVAKA